MPRLRRPASQGRRPARTRRRCRTPSRISPPLAPKGTRAGHDIGITVRLDAGMAIQEVDCRVAPGRTSSGTGREPGDGRAEEAGDDPEQGLRPPLPHRDRRDRRRAARPQGRARRVLHAGPPAAPAGRAEAGGRAGADLRARHQRVDARLPDHAGEVGHGRGDPTARARRTRSTSITFSGDTRILWDAPRPDNAGEPQGAPGVPRGREGRRRHRDDEGDRRRPEEAGAGQRRTARRRSASSAS